MSDNYAETTVTLFGLAALAIGTLAMFVRFLLNHRRNLRTAGRQFVADMKRGHGFTFHKTFNQSGDNQHQVDQPLPDITPDITPRQFLDLVNNQPDRIPHLFIEGGSGAGKTTFTKAVLADRRDQLAIIGVKADDAWGDGYIYRSAEREAALLTLIDEVNRRSDENDKTGLTIVLDDFTRLASHKPAVELYKLVADIGRSLRVRLILVARGRLVKGIGASGESDLLEHFVFVSLRRGDHAATLEIDEDVYQIDTSFVHRGAQQPINAGRWWKPKQQTGPHHDDSLLSRILTDSTSIPVRAEERPFVAGKQHTGMVVSAGTEHQEAIPVDTANEQHTSSIPATLTPEAIQTLYNAGWSKNKIATLLTGSKQRRLSIIDTAMVQEEVVHAE